MRLLALDLETTGLDVEKDQVTEIGWVLKDTEFEKPFLTEGFLLKVTIPVPELITNITGITDSILDEFGKEPEDVYTHLGHVMEAHGVEYIVAHNGNSFDKPMLHNNSKRHNVVLPEREWIDTRLDIKFSEHIRGRNLTYLCAEHGFINPFPHAALFDSMATMKLLSQYNVGEVLKYRAIPTIVIRAMVTFEEKDLAKQKGFSWQEANGKKFNKSWVKAIKETELESWKSQCDFQIGVVG